MVCLPVTAYHQTSHVWLKPFGNWTQQDKRDGVTGYNADNFGIALGGDTDVTSTWNVGIAGIYTSRKCPQQLYGIASTNRYEYVFSEALCNQEVWRVHALKLSSRWWCVNL